VYARPYAQILGVVLILVSLVGLALGNQVWLGIQNVDIVEDIVNLITGAIFAYVVFGRTDLSVTRNMVGLFYHSPGWDTAYPKIQILAINDLLHGAGVKMPLQYETFQEAQRARLQEPDHPQLELG
jgi:hypothetical protein